MPRSRSRLLDFGVYLGVRVFICVVQALSWSSAIALARAAAWLVLRVDQRHRRVADENLRHAFPHLNDVSIKQLVRDSYEHLLLMVVEIIRIPRVLHGSTIDKYLGYAVPADYEKAIALVRSGRPILALTGHFGNWEILSYAFGLLGFRGSLIARRLDNPFLDRFVTQFRRKTGQQILDKSQDYAKIQSTLAGGGYLGVVGDQDAGSRGLFVPFLGRPASTFKSIALLSLEYSAPIIVFGAARVGRPMKYVIYLEDIIYPEKCALERDPMRAITERYSDALERIVRRHPEQYFWVHRRWKNQPKAHRPKKVA